VSKNGLTLKTGLEFVQCHWKWHELDRPTSLNTEVVYTHVPGIYRHKYYTVTFKARLRVTQGH